MQRLSYSSISTYEECPLKWKLRYVDKLPEKPRGYFSFGRTVHEALEHFHTHDPPPAPLDRLLAFYDAHWVSEGYVSKEEEERYRALGRRILEEFHRRHADPYVRPVAVEKEMTFEVEGVPILGYVDLLVDRPGGAVEILDYKTGKRPITHADVLESDQLTLYQMAAEAEGRRVDRLTLYHLPTLTPVSVPPRGEGAKRAMAETVRSVASEIAAERFEPRLSDRCPCDYARHCPYFRDAFPTLDRWPAEERERVVGLVERFAGVQREAGDPALRRGMEEDLLAVMARRDLLRLFGREHAVLRVRMPAPRDRHGPPVQVGLAFDYAAVERPADVWGLEVERITPEQVARWRQA